MNPDYQSWRRSSHAAVQCVACHRGIELFGVLPLPHYVVNAFKESGGNYRKPINSDSRYGATEVYNRECLKCHSPGNRSFTTTHGLKVNSKIHLKHLDASLRCTNCHNRVAHNGAEKFEPLITWIEKKYNSQESLVGKRDPKFSYANNMRMRQGCWRCHKVGGKFVDVSGKVKTGPYQAANGAVAPTKCSTCHNKQWDIKPPGHKVKNKDGVDWKSGLNHGKVARKDFSSCQACHDKNTWCSTKCHKGITMPHIPKWKDVHMVWAKNNNRRADCRMCHEADPLLNFCGNRCHHDPFRKQFKLSDKVPWKIGKEQHGVAAKATGGQPCFRCHDQKTWCTTECHKGVTMPHKIPEWRQVHFKVAKEIGKDVCARCHNKDGQIKDFCLYCHHQKFGISLKADIYEVMSNASSKILSTSKLADTTKCFTHHHQPSFCINCHKKSD